MTPLMLSRMTGCNLLTASSVLVDMQSSMARFHIDTPARVAGFVATCAHESACFTRFEEDLNYRPETLMRVWPKRFPTLASTRFFAFSPEHLANEVYSDRMGNGQDHTGDGYRFRGRGPIQATGRQMYYDVGVKLGLPLMLHPDLLVSDPKAGWLSAACIWADIKGCNLLMDQGAFEATQRAINGGNVGAAERNALYAKCSKVLAEGVTQ